MANGKWKMDNGKLKRKSTVHCRLSHVPCFLWRKGWDSNPRNPFEVHSISSAASSTAPAPFRKTANNENGVAERVGFEPTVPVKVQQFSRLPDSTTLAPLRELLMIKACCRKYQARRLTEV